MISHNNIISKIALGIEYDGSNYHGWQKQKKIVTVQEKIEKAISIVANHSVSVFCAGRTDAGVHSTGGQVIHFETIAQRIDPAWILGINANLPADINVCWIKRVPITFHARFSALARRYIYIIYNHPIKSALFQGMLHVQNYLEADKMHRAGQCLLGEKDFSSFRSAYCQSNTPWRKLIHINVQRQGYYIVVDIKANSFVHHMVRNIVGSLIVIGSGKRHEQWIADLLRSKNRNLAAAKAHASGLYLLTVDYPEQLALPTYICPFFLKLFKI